MISHKWPSFYKKYSFFELTQQISLMEIIVVDDGWGRGSLFALYSAMDDVNNWSYASHNLIFIQTLHLAPLGGTGLEAKFRSGDIDFMQLCKLTKSLEDVWIHSDKFTEGESTLMTQWALKMLGKSHLRCRSCFTNFQSSWLGLPLRNPVFLCFQQD